MRHINLTVTLLFISFSLLQAQTSRSYPVTLTNGDYKPVAFSKAFWGEERYGNKELKFKGKFLKCTTRNGAVDVYEKRKIGKWTFYHANGTISRIENYTATESCNVPAVRNGKWQYFNNEGELYHEEIFRNDTLISSSIEIYRDSTLQQIIVHVNHAIDTVQIVQEPESENYVINGDFELYKHKPVLVINDGHNPIEQLIPGWNSPGSTSADYYHTTRKVLNVPKHFSDSVKESGHVGVLMYNSREEKYTEKLQTKLKTNLQKDQRYCLTFNMMLSINAGFYTEKVEALFSNEAINPLAGYKVSNKEHHMIYASTLDNMNAWQQICDCFVANGSERYLTLGLFSLTDAGITKTSERYFSSLDINTGAYYLIDNVVVKPVSENYTCTTRPVLKPHIQQQQLKLKQNIFAALLTGKAKSITFKNVQFETNRSDLKQESFPELEQLLIFLENSNANIEIAGYTDNVGQAEHNQTLSLARAESIKSWLVQRGIETERLLTVGFGATNFVADNNTEENRQRNRRVEIRLVAAE